MARMPGAEWLGEHSPRRPMARYDGVCVHTIVGFAPAHAAHFSVKLDGTILQSRDTAFQSAGNLDGNPRIIVIENEDGGKDIPLTPAQLESNAVIYAWAHKKHGIPLQLCPDSRPSSRGLMVHRQGIDGNFVLPANTHGLPRSMWLGRVSGGERWSTSGGKVCPRDNKIAQVPAILKRAKEIANPPKPKARLRVATFNVWVGQRGWRLRRNLRKMAKAAGWPHVIALQEAGRLRRAPRGYVKVVPLTNRREAKNNVLLLRAKDVKLYKDRPLPIQGDPWVGPKKQAKTHPPRVHVGATVEAEDKLRDFLGVHRVTVSDGKNEEQRRVEAEQIESWIKARLEHRPDRMIVALGDWNGTPDRLARRVGGVLAMDEIDGAVVINAKVLRVRKLKRRFGSDNHFPVVIDIEER